MSHQQTVLPLMEAGTSRKPGPKLGQKNVKPTEHSPKFFEKQKKKARKALDLWLQGYDFKEIGQRLSSSSSSRAASNWLKKAEQLFGAQALERDFLTIGEAANWMSLNRETIVRWCEIGRLILWEKAINGQVIFRSAGLAELQWLAEAGDQVKCANPECPHWFPSTGSGSTGRRCCCVTCRYRLTHLERQAAGLLTNPGKTTHRPGTFQALLVEALVDHQLSTNEEWVSLSRAVKLTGLTKIQLIWLARTKVVTTKEDTQKLWKGKQPVVLYAASELLATKSVHDIWQTAQSARSK